MMCGDDVWGDHVMWEGAVRGCCVRVMCEGDVGGCCERMLC